MFRGIHVIYGNYVFFIGLPNEMLESLTFSEKGVEFLDPNDIIEVFI
jgi:hypothetical protein